MKVFLDEKTDVLLSELDDGAVFRLPGTPSVYMKLNEPCDGDNCVTLSGGSLVSVREDRRVYHLQGGFYEDNTSDCTQLRLAGNGKQ